MNLAASRRDGAIIIVARIDQLVLQALLLSQVMAAAWWFVALWLRSTDLIPVWYDQDATFLRLTISQPYAIFLANPPWLTVFMAPFSQLPLPLAVLIQTCLYFGILALLVCKYNGGLRTVALVLTSFLALDNALELNVDWIVGLGLLLPTALSGPFLLVKPQDAAGAIIAYHRRELVRAVILTLLVMLAAFLLWGDWISPLAYNLTYRLPREYNIAPLAFLPWQVSFAIGLTLGKAAFCRKDVPVGILAGLFFIPYLKFYSLLLPGAMLAVKWPRLALIINLVMWVIYGGVIFGYIPAMLR